MPPKKKSLESILKDLEAGPSRKSRSKSPKRKRSKSKSKSPAKRKRSKSPYTRPHRRGVPIKCTSLPIKSIVSAFDRLEIPLGKNNQKRACLRLRRQLSPNSIKLACYDLPAKDVARMAKDYGLPRRSKEKTCKAIASIWREMS